MDFYIFRIAKIIGYRNWGVRILGVKLIKFLDQEIWGFGIKKGIEILKFNKRVYLGNKQNRIL